MNIFVHVCSIIGLVETFFLVPSSFDSLVRRIIRGPSLALFLLRQCRPNYLLYWNHFAQNCAGAHVTCCICVCCCCCCFVSVLIQKKRRYYNNNNSHDEARSSTWHAISSTAQTDRHVEKGGKSLDRPGRRFCVVVVLFLSRSLSTTTHRMMCIFATSLNCASTFLYIFFFFMRVFLHFALQNKQANQKGNRTCAATGRAVGGVVCSRVVSSELCVTAMCGRHAILLRQFYWCVLIRTEPSAKLCDGLMRIAAVCVKSIRGRNKNECATRDSSVRTE